MFLRQCLQEVRIRRGEFDLFLGGDGRRVGTDRGDTRDGSREVGAELALSRAELLVATSEKSRALRLNILGEPSRGDARRQSVERMHPVDRPVGGTHGEFGLARALTT